MQVWPMNPEEIFRDEELASKFSALKGGWVLNQTYLPPMDDLRGPLWTGWLILETPPLP